MKVGLITNWLPLELRAGLIRAKQMGAHGVQLWIVGNELEPRKLDKSGRRELIGFMASLGLERSALCGDLKGFGNPATVDENIARTKEMFDLCLDLQTPILTTHIGTVPEDKGSGAYAQLVEAVREVAEYAAERGCCFATETGTEPAERLAEFLGEVNCDGAKVNYDPANFLMRGFEHLQGVQMLKKYIVHTHAKDALSNQLKEMPLGKGDVDIPAYLSALRAIQYTGYVTIERKYAQDPLGELPEAIKLLKTLEGVDG